MAGTPTGRAALLILWRDLRQRSRDRSAYLFGLVVPFGLAAIFSLVFGSVLEGDLDVTVGVLDQANNDATRPFVTTITGLGDEGLDGRALADPAQAETALADGTVDAVIVLPEGMGFTPGVTPRVLAHADKPTSAQVAAGIARSYAGIVAATGQAAAAATELGVLGDVSIPQLADSVASSGSAYFLDDIAAELRQLDGPTYVAAGMAVMFLFFTVGFGVIGFLEERRDGTLARLQAAPISAASIVAGKGLTSFVLGLATMTTLVVSSQLLLDASWGPPLGVGLLVLGGVLAATAIVTAIAAVARTVEQAEVLQTVVAVGLGMLGGSFFPLGDGSGLLGAVSRATPHHWFLDGLADIQGGAKWTAALPSVGALVLFAVGATLLAAALSRWRRT